MIKLTIPVILAATIVVAGLFAFAPVEQASTVHETVATSISGAPTVVSETVSSFDLSDAGQGSDNRENHHFVLTSETAFTIVDIEIVATIESASNNDNAIRMIDKIVSKLESLHIQQNMEQMVFKQTMIVEMKTFYSKLKSCLEMVLLVL